MYILFPRFRLRISVFALPIFLIMLWTEGLVAFFIIIASALLHEFGHLITMRILGYRERRIDILPMGALIVCPEGITHKNEFKIAISGPIISLLSALLLLICFCAFSSPYLLFSVLINAVFGIFNLMPVKNLDGGKAIYSYLLYKNKKSAERICSVASVSAKAVFLLFGIACIILSEYNLGVTVMALSLMIQLK